MATPPAEKTSGEAAKAGRDRAAATGKAVTDKTNIRRVNIEDLQHEGWGAWCPIPLISGFWYMRGTALAKL
tara:strand:+ start:427 stop:639 length:213 start_codon:yes stop_codon:yes gene_type:complete